MAGDVGKGQQDDPAGEDQRAGDPVDPQKVALVDVLVEQAAHRDQERPPERAADEHPQHQRRRPAQIVGDVGDVDGGEDGGEGDQGDGIGDHDEEGGGEVPGRDVEARPVGRRRGKCLPPPRAPRVLPPSPPVAAGAGRAAA